MSYHVDVIRSKCLWQSLEAGPTKILVWDAAELGKVLLGRHLAFLLVVLVLGVLVAGTKMMNF